MFDSLWFMPVVVIGVYCFVLLPKYVEFKQSSYEKDANLSFFQMIFDAGFRGEYHIYRVLEKLPIKKRLFVNVYVPKEKDQFAEIDLVMLTSKGIFVIESKNYAGWIFGSENKKFWTQTLPGKKIQKNKFFNPIWQNQGHISALEHVLKDYKLPYHSLIIFSNRSEFKKLELHNFSGVIVNLKKLPRIMKDFAGYEDLIDAKTLSSLSIELNQYSRRSADFKRKHVESIQNTVK